MNECLNCILEVCKVLFFEEICVINLGIELLKFIFIFNVFCGKFDVFVNIKVIKVFEFNIVLFLLSVKLLIVWRFVNVKL